MDNTEGSVMVDGMTPDVKEETQEQHVENQEESKKTDSEQKTEGQTEDKTEGTEGDSKTEDKTEGEEGKDEKKDVTDKGTKLDSDPLRQAHQLRANAERRTKQYEDFLNDPAKVRAYLQDLEKEQGNGKTDEKTEDLITADKIETVDDLKKFARQLETKSQREIEAVKKQVGGVIESDRVKSTANRIGSEVKSVQDKYPVLREFNTDGSKNPDYNEELDTAIGQFYNELDLDRRTGMYRGQHSILKIADQFMKVRGIGMKSGSQQAQTIVKDKRTGRVITNQGGGSDGQPDEEKQSAAQTIAARMKRAVSRTR